MNIRALAVIAALVAIPGAANADGLPAPPPPPVAAPDCCAPVALWTGVYVGGHGGGAWGDPTWTFPTITTFNSAPGQSFSISADGAIAGGQVGVNYQFHPHLLIGAEASYAGSRFSNVFTGAIPGFPGDRLGVKAHDLLTVTGRLGFVHDQYLFYAKGGWANSSVQVGAESETGAATGTTAYSTRRENGWTIGGGIESRIISNIIFGLEYNYVSLPNDRFTAVTGGTLPGAPFTADIDGLHMHAVVARLGILFGPNACCAEGVLGKW
jgi:outer membrane immunogenic protein